MAQITFTIPDAYLPRIVAAFGANPKSKIIDLVKARVQEYERIEAAKAASAFVDIPIT